MTVDAYINPDFTGKEKLIFFLVTFLLTLICVFLICGVSTIISGFRKNKRRRRPADADDEYEYEEDEWDEQTEERRGADFVLGHIQLFYEMIISGTSVMFFSCSYIIMSHLYSVLSELPEGSAGEPYATFMMIWEGYKDFVLLLFICLSCVLNSILDRLIIPLKLIDRTEKASVRLLAMFYAIAILVFLNNFGDSSEYSPVMMYYLGLMVGRFIYFDASFRDFLENICRAFSNIFMLILGLCLTGALCYYGFNSGYLLEKNYYIVGVFYTHIFLLGAIFLLHHSRLFNLILRRRK